MPESPNVWDLFLLDAVLFLLFLLSTLFTRKVKPSPTGIFKAFVIALFSNMYGLSLLTYFLSSYVERLILRYSPSFHSGILGSYMSLAAISIGVILLGMGWQQLYDVYYKEGRLVRGGLYGVVRHPQYLGILLITFGWLIFYDTLINILLWPTLVILYYRLAKREEVGMEKRFGHEYREYRRRVPMFIPLVAPRKEASHS